MVRTLLNADKPVYLAPTGSQKRAAVPVTDVTINTSMNPSMETDIMMTSIRTRDTWMWELESVYLEELNYVNLSFPASFAYAFFRFKEHRAFELESFHKVALNKHRLHAALRIPYDGSALIEQLQTERLQLEADYLFQSLKHRKMFRYLQKAAQDVYDHYSTKNPSDRVREALNKIFKLLKLDCRLVDEHFGEWETSSSSQ